MSDLCDLFFIFIFIFIMTDCINSRIQTQLWCVGRFGISHYLPFVWSFERTRTYANAFFYLTVVSTRLYDLAWRSNGSIKCQTLEYQSSNLTTFECCFLISKYHENCNVMSSFTVIHHETWNTFIWSVAQYLRLLWLLWFLRSHFKNQPVYTCEVQKMRRLNYFLKSSTVIFITITLVPKFMNILM